MSEDQQRILDLNNNPLMKRENDDETTLVEQLQRLQTDKKELERDQKTARVGKHSLINRSAELAVRFNALAIKYLSKRDFNMFAAVVQSSIISQFIVSIVDMDDEGNGTASVSDRCPISMPVDVNSRQELTYIVNILALNNSGILQSGECRTVVEEESPSGWKPCDNLMITEASNDMQRKGRKRTANQASEPFSQGFKIDVQESGATLNCWPSERTLNDFVVQHSNSVGFPIKNLTLRNRDFMQRNSTSYRLRSTLKLQCKYNDVVVTIELNDHQGPGVSNVNYYFEPVTSLSFLITSNESVTARSKTTFAFIWSILVEYYQSTNDVKPQVGTGGQELKHSLPWYFVREFLAGFLGSLLNVSIRKLTSSELRTIQSIILTRRVAQIQLQKFGSGYRRWMTNNLTEDDIRSLEDNLFGCVITTRFTGEPYSVTLNRLIYQAPLPDKTEIYEEDFTDECVDSMVKTEGPTHLNFSLYQWLRGIADSLAGSHLHNKESRKTIILFQKHILSMRSDISATSIMTEIFQRSSKSAWNDNILLLRFNERALQSLTFHFADTQLRGLYFAYEDVVSIGTERYSFHPATDQGTLERARRSGVVKANGNEFFGLYALLRTGYYSRFRRIFAGVVEESQGGSKRKGKVVAITGIKADNCTPMYDFELHEAPFLESQINGKCGPKLLPPNPLYNGNHYISIATTNEPSLPSIPSDPSFPSTSSFESEPVEPPTEYPTD